MKDKHVWSVLFYSGLIVLLLLPLLLVSQADSDTQRLDAFLTTVKATPKEQQAYHFAIKHPEVLRFIPCYCGCGKQGHKHNYNCFIKGNGEKGKPLKFDDHGIVCPMCVDIALKSEELLAKGYSVKQIRDFVDKAFSKFPHLHSTPTDKPTG